MCTLALNGWRRIAAAGIAGLGTWLASAPSARADVTVIINYDFVETRVSPRQEVVSTHMTESYKISNNKGVDYAGSTGTKARAKLGTTMTGSDEAGDTSQANYRIINGAVVITTHNAGFFHILRITTDGRTACSATKKFYPNPGHQYLEGNTLDGSVHTSASNFSAANMTCSIQE